ncbi:hypothetical protein ACVWXO_009904 [Bradyrhizobium sp. LM2.7]
MQSSSRVSASRLPERFRDRLRLPIIAAPMLHLSGPDLVVAACQAGVIGAFPTMNPRVLHADGGLDGWLSDIRRRLAENPGASGPVCPNLIMRADDLDDHVDTILRHGVEMVITSVGSPKPIMARLKEAGVFVFADVATVEHARKALDVGVDGLVLLTAGCRRTDRMAQPICLHACDPRDIRRSPRACRRYKRWGCPACRRNLGVRPRVYGNKVYCCARKLGNRRIPRDAGQVIDRRHSANESLQWPLGQLPSPIDRSGWTGPR